MVTRDEAVERAEVLKRCIPDAVLQGTSTRVRDASLDDVVEWILAKEPLDLRR